MDERYSDEAAIFGTGAVRDRADGVDWSKTTLGPIGEWPERLRLTLESCVASADPTALFWGEDRTLLFNDSYAETVLGGETQALGAPLAALSAKPTSRAETLLQSIFSTGRPLKDGGHLLALLEWVDPRAMITSLSPVPDGQGGVAGVVHRAIPDERGGQQDSAMGWQSVVLEVNDTLRDLEDLTAVLEGAARIIARHLGLERAGFGLVDADGNALEIDAEWRVSDTITSIRGRHDLESFGPLITQRLAEGQEIFEGDMQARMRAYGDSYARRFRDIGARAMANIPIIREGRLEAVFFGHHHESRAWQPQEVLLAREAVERSWIVAERLRGRAQLEGVSTRLRLALEAGGLATWEHDLKADRMEWSEEHYKILGYRPDEVKASFALWRDSVHPDDKRATMQALDLARDNRTVYHATFRVLRPGGEVRWCTGRGIFFYASDGTPVRMIGVLEDITGEHDAEAALRESEERFRLILESARDYAIFTTDSNGIIDGWPPGAVAVFGWQAHEVIGQPADVLFTDEDRANGVPAQEIGTARRTGHAMDVRWHRHKSGARVFIDGSVRPLWGPAHELRGFLKIGQDVTQRRKDELALRESEERFRLLTNTIPHLVFRSSGRGERAWNSPQWHTYTGQDEADAKAFGWLQAIHPDDRSATLAAWERAGETGDYFCEHRILRFEDGAYRWHQSRAVLLAGLNFPSDEWVGTSSDVHDLRDLQQRQEVLVAELQHRTRNLLAVVRAVSNDTLSSADSVFAYKEQFNERLAALSRVQVMLTQSQTSEVTIENLLRMELDAMAPHWQQISLSGPQASLKASSVQILALAIHELCTNAIKYGALAEGAGHLEVTWAIETGADGEREVDLLWTERLAQPLQTPHAERVGYGRQLIEYALSYQLGAQTTFELEPEGLKCRLIVPIATRGSRATPQE